MKKSSCRSHLPPNPSAKPLLIVLSGPSGAGKDAVLKRLKKLDPSLKHITTVTTRPRRPREKNGIDYYFVSIERFQEMIAHNELLEQANVYGNWYGVPYGPVKQALDNRQEYTAVIYRVKLILKVFISLLLRITKRNLTAGG